MRRLASLLVLGISILSCGFSVQAAPAPAVRGHTLEDCFQAALKRSEVVGTQQELIVQAEERVRQATGGLLPSVNGTAYRRWQETPESGTGGAFYPPVQDQVSVGVSQPLFRGMREYAALRQTKDLRQAARYSLRQAELGLYRDVAQAFYNVLWIERDLANLQEQLGLYGKRIRELQERIRIGRSRVSERLTIEAAEAALRAQGDTLRGQLDVAREVLAFQTGLAKDVALADSDRALKADPVDAYLKRIEERPDVQAERERVTASEENVTIAQGGHLPSLDLGGNYYFIRPGVLSSSHWDVTLQLSLPIYAGGTVQSRVRESVSLQTQSELALSRARRLAEQEVRSLHATVLSDLRQIQSLAESTRLSERNYAEQSREYRLGLVTNLEVLQALTSFEETQRSLDRARYSLKNDLERLETAAALKPARLPDDSGSS